MKWIKLTDWIPRPFVDVHVVVEPERDVTGHRGALFQAMDQWIDRQDGTQVGFRSTLCGYGKVLYVAEIDEKQDANN
jgi:hypothetical protein